MVTEESDIALAELPEVSEASEPTQPAAPYEPTRQPSSSWEPAADSPASSQRRTAGGTGRAARKRTGRPGKKTTARKNTAKKATGARGTAGGTGSTHLADSLTSLLNDVTAEVATVSALAAAIDEASRGLQAQLEEYTERMGTLSRLRRSASGGTLAAFLDETLVPERPAELSSLTDGVKVAQSATI